MEYILKTEYLPNMRGGGLGSIPNITDTHKNQRSIYTWFSIVMVVCFLCGHLRNQAQNTQLERHRLYPPRGWQLRKELATSINKVHTEKAGWTVFTTQVSRAPAPLRSPNPSHTQQSLPPSRENAVEHDPLWLWCSHLSFLLETLLCLVALSGLK